MKLMLTGSDGIFFQHARTATAVTESHDCRIKIEIDITAICQIAVMTDGINVSYGIRKSGSGDYRSTSRPAQPLTGVGTQGFCGTGSTLAG